MANEKPIVLDNKFESTIGVKRDKEGKVVRDAEGKPVPDTRVFEIQVVYPTLEDVVKAAVKYSTWKSQGLVRGHFIPDKKTGKTKAYGLLPGIKRQVDPEGKLLMSREDKKAKLLAELAAIEAEEQAELESVGTSQNDEDEDTNEDVDEQENNN
jgi:hypothetical protein